MRKNECLISVSFTSFTRLIFSGINSRFARLKKALASKRNKEGAKEPRGTYVERDVQ